MKEQPFTTWVRIKAAELGKTETDLQRYGLTFEKINQDQIEPGVTRLDGTPVLRGLGAGAFLRISKALDLEINAVLKAYIRCLKDQ